MINFLIEFNNILVFYEYKFIFKAFKKEKLNSISQMYIS